MAHSGWSPVRPAGVARTLPGTETGMDHAAGASPGNLSPWNRNIVYLSLNRCDNAIRRFGRPPSIAHRDLTPLVALGEDALQSQTVTR